jgi:hypothetical protein
MPPVVIDAMIGAGLLETRTSASRTRPQSEIRLCQMGAVSAPTGSKK